MKKPGVIKVETRKLIIVVTAAVIVLNVFLYLFDVQVTPRWQTQLSVGALTEKVAPASGYSVDIKWGDVGQKLVEAGAIDLEQYQQIYPDVSYLTQSKSEGITLNKDTAYFWVNTLWALGLTQKSDVLEKGVMMTQYGDDLGNFASTAGWTLGSKDALELYSSAEIIPLSAEQQAKVAEIASNIYRPCCGNSAAFPDCNHGMAILGLVELMVSQGFSEEEIYKAALVFNSYWFVDTYVDLAYYFQTVEGIRWSKVDPKEVLSDKYSSASGYGAIKQIIGNIPGAPVQGASCGA